MATGKCTCRSARFAVFCICNNHFPSPVKSQYAAQIKTLPLKFGEYQYFDVASLNGERYGEENLN